MLRRPGAALLGNNGRQDREGHAFHTAATVPIAIHVDEVGHFVLAIDCEHKVHVGPPKYADAFAASRTEFFCHLILNLSGCAPGRASDPVPLG